MRTGVAPVSGMASSVGAGLQAHDGRRHLDGQHQQQLVGALLDAQDELDVAAGGPSSTMRDASGSAGSGASPPRRPARWANQGSRLPSCGDLRQPAADRGRVAGEPIERQHRQDPVEAERAEQVVGDAIGARDAMERVLDQGLDGAHQVAPEVVRRHLERLRPGADVDALEHEAHAASPRCRRSPRAGARPRRAGLEPELDGDLQRALRGAGHGAQVAGRVDQRQAQARARADLGVSVVWIAAATPMTSPVIVR